MSLNREWIQKVCFISTMEYRILIIHPTYPKILYRIESHCKDVSVPLRSGNSITTGGRERDQPGWDVEQDWKGYRMSYVGDKRKA